MKMFLLRELAFLLAPVLMFTRLKALAARGVGLLALVIFIVALANTLGVFVLQPAGWAWLGVIFGLVVAFMAFVFLLTMGSAK